MKASLEEEIRQVMSEGPEAGMWGDPVLASAHACDPMFDTLRQVAGPSHLAPRDVLEGARTVVVFFVPFSRHIVSSNAGGRFQSEAWAMAYIQTNALIEKATLRLCGLLRRQGFEAAGIQPTHNFDETTLVSRWSHRHAAFIAGLGTFGLNRMLITEKGCCGRLGSVITSARLEPDPRPGREYCLFRRDGSCSACIARCPSGALSADGFDRRRCYETLLSNEGLYPHLGKADACGKCLCALPCSMRIPA